MQGLDAGQRLIDRFELIRRLGRGGMGEVWLARDGELGEEVALKVLADALARDARYVELLKQECRKARQLVHPNIVRVYDFHADERTACISMQYVDGDSLAAAGAQPARQVVAHALVLCDALDYAHRSGIVHRDVKPANVLRDKNGGLFLADFGIASLTGAAEPDPARGGGSLPYLSPQQIRGEAPAVADDVYALGALIYELLAGSPPFHPDVTTARIFDEAPLIPSEDRTGETIPLALRNLVAACLEKNAELRPAGTGAVRAVLEELEADLAADEIKPVRRRAAATESSAPAAPAVLPDSGKRSLPPAVVYGGLGLLAVVAIVVVFVLPNVVSERRASAPPPAEPPRPDLAQSDAPPAVSEAQREIADEALGELLVLDGRLRDIGVTLWGGQDWLDARAAADAGDAAYRERDFSQATVRYREALAVMRALEPRAPSILEQALEDAQAALATGNQAEAVRNFELALAIDADKADARAGLERAMQLDRVLELMARARENESAGDVAAARAAYEEVLALDPQWEPGREGAARTAGVIRAGLYERRMAAGYAALEGGRYAEAGVAFRAALEARPGDADAQRALRQVASERQLARVTELQRRADALADEERWDEAAAQYQAVLDVDATVAAAQEGLKRAQERVRLERELNEQIERSDRFYEDAVVARAREVLKRAQTVAAPGPKLKAQIGELATLLARSAIPVTVQFQSDNLTDVVIYKVGRLGTFLTRDLSLKPGSYVAVGSRQGYRDVRRNFTVSSDGAPPPIVLRCEEPI